MHRLIVLPLLLLTAVPVVAEPTLKDRVYTADQNSNTVSVIDPAHNTLLGQIRLGNARPDILSPLYKGEINVHGLGFSPDGKTLLVIANGSNSVTFVDTQTNKVKGTAYIGRSPHEGFFTPDGKEVWAVVRGENYISVIDPVSFKEVQRIETSPGPGMVIFQPNGHYAFVCNSFNPVVEVVDVAKRQVVKKIPVVSPFSPFIQITPDQAEVWLTHKDVGKVTRIDAKTLEVKEVINTGFITNHLAFSQTNKGTFAYVTIGGENAVKVFTTATPAKLMTTIPVGSLPHGIWSSADGSRIYVGLENGDAIDVIDAMQNKVIAHVPVGQAPQALVYVANAVPEGNGAENLSPRLNTDPISLHLQPQQGGAGAGTVVVRNLGLIDSFEISLAKLKPATVYKLYGVTEKTESLIAALETNAKGAANGSIIGPVREAISLADKKALPITQLILMESDMPPSVEEAALATTNSEE